MHGGRNTEKGTISSQGRSASIDYQNFIKLRVKYVLTILKTRDFMV